jgi:ABC-type nitrate/sulfonate/bicarbonate transport system substrate-binding protein
MRMKAERFLRFKNVSSAVVFAAAITSATMLPRTSPAAEPTKVTIGYQSLWAAGGEVVEVLRHTNIFELNGIDAQYKTFTFGGPLAEAAVAGDIDNVFAADAPVLRAMARMPGSKILQRTHDARFGILVQPDFNGSLADLKGKKLSAPFATTTFPRSVKALVAAGIQHPFQDMTIINQDIAEQTNAMQGHLVDAVTTWDPTMERLLQQKLAKVLWSAPRGENIGMQGFSGKWLQANGNGAAVRFLKAWIMATWWASNHMDQAHQWFAETSRLPIDLLKVSTDFDRNLNAPIKDIGSIDLTLTDADIAGSQGVMDFLYDNKLLNAKMDVKPYFDMGPLHQAAAEIKAGKHPDLDAIKIIKQ